jgi:hypothetical protein
MAIVRNFEVTGTNAGSFCVEFCNFICKLRNLLLNNVRKVGDLDFFIISCHAIRYY